MSAQTITIEYAGMTFTNEGTSRSVEDYARMHGVDLAQAAVPEYNCYERANGIMFAPLSGYRQATRCRVTLI